MEDILTYGIVFGLLIIFTYVFLSKKDKTKRFSLSQKIYSYGNIDVRLEKQGKEITFLVIKYSLKDVSPDYFKLTSEMVLIDNSILLVEIPQENILFENKSVLKIPFDVFSNLLKEKTKQLNYFKIVITFASNKKLKSGILAFNKRWNIYAPDSGKYN